MGASRCSVVVAIVLGAFASSALADVPMFEDLSFDRGFLLGYPHASKGRAVEATLDLGQAGAKPAWRLCQWATKYSLADTPCVQGEDGDVYYENPGKRVVVGGANSLNRDLILDIRGGAEYGDRPRQAGQGWPHLLVEQDAVKPFRLDVLERIDLNVSVKLLHCTSHMAEAEYNPGLHAAQFQLFFIVKNINPEAKDYRDFFWFGVPFFDNRHKSPQAYMAKDGGKADATGKFIYTVAAADLAIASLHDRQWISVDTNLLPHIKYGLAEAVQRGYLANGDLRDYAVVNMNMGWEIPGTFDAAVQVKDLRIWAVPSDKPHQMMWQKTKKEVPHGQGIWAGNFIDDEPGQEVIILRSGHVGDFITVRGTDGVQLAAFRHKRTFKGYPDFPCVVNWKSGAEQSLWVPIDRTLVDGRGRVVAELGDCEPLVAEKLKWGETKSNLAVQAFALDLCGDAREELVLYQPYNGQAILIFTQPDSDGRDKPYVHDEDAYNIRSYF